MMEIRKDVFSADQQLLNHAAFQSQKIFSNLVSKVFHARSAYLRLKTPESLETLKGLEKEMNEAAKVRDAAYLDAKNGGKA